VFVQHVKGNKFIRNKLNNHNDKKKDDETRKQKNNPFDEHLPLFK